LEGFPENLLGNFFHFFEGIYDIADGDFFYAYGDGVKKFFGRIGQRKTFELGYFFDWDDHFFKYHLVDAFLFNKSSVRQFSNAFLRQTHLAVASRTSFSLVVFSFSPDHFIPPLFKRAR
jgi:hypothetical protein